jgi:hypothetical protein
MTEQEAVAQVLGQHNLSHEEKFVQDVLWRTYWTRILSEIRFRCDGLPGYRHYGRRILLQPITLRAIGMIASIQMSCPLKVEPLLWLQRGSLEWLIGGFTVLSF